ncbi:MAG: HlyD family efflux transporter periplasmic adaptor subunit [Anaerolineae bacterium]|nr:HlyD family efflux transporter periplasmic adaptor subunit [Anaerolineae bacterium]
MREKARIVGVVGGLILIAVLGLVGYFAWINIAYVDTLHAQIEGRVVQVRAPVVGRVVDAPLQVGDAVAADEAVATVETVISTGEAGPTRLRVPVRAPLDGLIAEQAVQVGDGLTSGQMMMTLVDPTQLWITASIHESRIPQVELGQRVRVRVRTRTWRRRFWGQVEQIGAATTLALREGATTTTARPEVPVIISFDPAGYELYPGMTVDVRIKLDARQWW